MPQSKTERLVAQAVEQCDHQIIVAHRNTHSLKLLCRSLELVDVTKQIVSFLHHLRDKATGKSSLLARLFLTKWSCNLDRASNAPPGQRQLRVFHGKADHGHRLPRLSLVCRWHTVVPHSSVLISCSQPTAGPFFNDHLYITFPCVEIGSIQLGNPER